MSKLGDKQAFGYGVPPDPNGGIGGYPAENIEGMTMREYMATHILIAVKPDGYTDYEGAVKDAVKLADLLIEELDRTK